MLVTGVSRKGGRPINEDAYGEVRAGGVLCAVIADGLGGHNGGKTASQLAVDTILCEFKAAPEFSTQSLGELIDAANMTISEKAKSNPEMLQMSTTVAVLLVKGRRAMWAHAGDSRLYRFDEGHITEVTDDHSLAFSDFLEGKTEYGGIRDSENRNKLTNALGLYFKGAEIHDIVKINTATAFLLCTDGWWEYITEQQMEQTLNMTKTAHKWIDAMLDIHSGAAPRDNDNYTALAVKI